MEESIAGGAPNNLPDLLLNLLKTDKKSANHRISDKLPEWTL
ncbi:hypothetical protein [Polaromonas sp.]